MKTLWDRVADSFDPPTTHGWAPQPKQAIAERLSRQVVELLYGGAAGGGKTEWGLEHVIGEMERHPGNRGGIFRRVHPSLARTVIPRLKEKLTGRARWNANEKTFTFPNSSVIELGSLQYADDVIDFQGAEYGVMFFEEVTEFLESQWEFLLTRLRAPVDGVRPHAVATTNPGGPGHRWVKRRWVAPPGVQLEPYAVWRPAATPEHPDPLTRVFVPATLDDNPALLARDPEYRSRLRQVSSRGLRRALEEGDWDSIDAVEGALWLPEWLDAGRMRSLPTESLRRGIALDPSDGDAGGDEMGVAVGCLGLDGVAYVELSSGWSASPQAMAESAVELYRDLRCDVMVVEKNHGGRWVPALIHSVDPTVNVKMTWASEGKRTRAEPVAALFEPRQDMSLRHRARLVGFHLELEEELTHFTGAAGETSPNRLDAMVWLLWELALRRRPGRKSTYDDQRMRGRR